MSPNTDNIIVKIRGLIKDTARSDGRNVFEYDNDSSFLLSEEFVKEPGMKVSVNGVTLSEDNWNYSNETNRVIITSSLNKGDIVMILFSYYAKYSDTEILSYIGANLTRFTQKRYQKTFYLNEDNEVLDLDDEEPTFQEKDIISLITAIDIDPQNINVRIGNDFTISATEKRSKSELINNVLNEFCRSYGIVVFLHESEDN